MIWLIRWSLHLSKIFLKRLRLLTYSFKAQKSLLRFDSILPLIFFSFYYIIILIVFLIRLKKFTCLNYCSICFDAFTLCLFISRKIDRIHWRLKYLTSLGLATDFNSSFRCQPTSWNIFSRLLCNQFCLEAVQDGLHLLKIVSCY